MTLKRGDVHYAELAEIGRKRVLILSWNEIQRRLQQPVICLLTKNDRERSLDTYVPIYPPEAGVDVPSYILCHALVTVDATRFDPEPLGTVSLSTMQAVEEALKRVLGLP